MNGALVYALTLIGSFVLGIVLYVKRRDGKVRLMSVVLFNESVPGVFLSAARSEGLRFLRRPEMVFFSLSFLLLVGLLAIPGLRWIWRHL